MEYEDAAPNERGAGAEPGRPNGAPPTAAAQNIRLRPGFELSEDIRIITDPVGPQAESIGALRAQLLAQHLRDGRRSLALCGPTSGVGSTFVAANLAVAFALAGKKTLLIDANMREPGISTLIRPAETRAGLMEYLADDYDEVEFPVEVDILPNLSVVYAGSGTGNPQELLAGEKFTDIINDGMRTFDITIVDTPASNEHADALRIAMVVRYALLVARKDHTSVADIRDLRNQLMEDRVRLVGAFLNDF